MVNGNTRQDQIERVFLVVEFRDVLYFAVELCIGTDPVAANVKRLGRNVDDRQCRLRKSLMDQDREISRARAEF